ncbi:putative enoyl-CoA hydratase/isomerase family protein [Neospora caninum Liverpool]|uniref:Enoyl-CoA hydratase/isomerase family protein,putative n=1 Tax=Neospora caninum (strain Liverpool) TaxID=572307 RepID=F0VFJ1_NEOCL|nr:putative enoyl-CoA hydratase/isomerase family protein [Neospora caninum Liverpool]CBZ52485.1 putative enoyl-CoA hydratase/isomerase family protein [Neospora caninum Liverpool]CEL66462.1 TPA: enoyl-CoA hydratase/isomerase family protein,putative [Neospora caninum Liverpool]|eukprot:XP_003882517.1 putative enoyl-CoA hydratase/isomerase family protein [Neospora caninum Liverpool]
MWRHAFSRSAAIRQACQRRTRREKPTAVLAGFSSLSSLSQAEMGIVSRPVYSTLGDLSRCPSAAASKCVLSPMVKRMEPCVESNVPTQVRSTSEGLSFFTSSSSTAIVPDISPEQKSGFLPKPGYVVLTPPDHKYIEAELISGGQFAVITLNRPDAKNAINQEVLKEFETCLNLVDAHAEKESDFHALLIRSAVPGVFCGGADLKERVGMTCESSREFVDRLRSCFERLSEVPYPTIACLHGAVMGGGLELALAADFRVASVRPPPSTLPPRDLFAPLSSPCHPKDDGEKPQSASLKSRVTRQQSQKKDLPLRPALEQATHLSPDAGLSRTQEQNSLSSAGESSHGICDPPGVVASVRKGDLEKSAAKHHEKGGAAPPLSPRQRAALARKSCSWCSSLELCLPEVSLGTMPGAGGTQRLWRVVGPQKAKLLLLTGGNVGPKQAVQWGLVDVMAGHNEDEVCKIWRFSPGLRRHKADRGEPGFPRGGNETEEKQVAQRIVLEARRNRFESRQARTAGQAETGAGPGDSDVSGSRDLPQQHEAALESATDAIPAHQKKSSFETEIPDAEWEGEDAFRVGIRLACRLASLAPLSVRVTKQTANSAVDVSMKAGLVLEGKAYDRVLSSEDRSEGLLAFRERRKPKFKGK